MQASTDTHLTVQFLLLFLCVGISRAAILDFDQWMEERDDQLPFNHGIFNLSRDAKISSGYGRPSHGPYGGSSYYGYGHSRPPSHYNYGHYYRPYHQKPTTSTTPPPPPPECGSGPYHGGPPLLCMLRTECIAQGGVLGEPCGKGFSRGFCCEFPHRVGCGETTSEVHSLFRNPDYPDTSSMPFSCIAGIIPRPEACGIRIEFLDALMGQSIDGYCYQDSFTVLGGGSLLDNGFNTPFCGIIKGYSTVIPVNQTSELIQLVVNTQSRNVMWNVNVTQIHCSSLYLPFDDLCGVSKKRSLRATTNETAQTNNKDLSWTEDTSLFPLPASNNLSGAKILGGVPTSPAHKYPWMVALRYDNELVCGGTLIARQWVATAAHCVTLYAADTLIPIKRFRVWLGSYDLAVRYPQTTERLRLVRKLERIYIHPEYEGNNYDFAILKLNETVIFNSAIRPICFPEDPDRHYTGFDGIISGWGSNGGGPNPTTLLEATVPIVSNTECSSKWSVSNIFISDAMICAGIGAAATCTSDGGGPLVVQEEDGLHVMVGVASFGAPPACGNPDFPDVYTRISNYISWIALVLAIPLPDF